MHEHAERMLRYVGTIIILWNGSFSEADCQ